MTRADRIARELEAVALEAERIQALSRTNPHVFAEEKDLVARKLRNLASAIRNNFGGAPARLTPGLMRRDRGRAVRVEVRRAV